MRYSKTNEKVRNWITSVSTRILLIMIALVLPLNVIAIVYTNKAMQVFIDQAEFNIQKMLDYKMQELENDMENTQAFLTYFVRQDKDCLIMQKKNISEYDFDSAKMKVHVKIRNTISLLGDADGFFYYSPERADGVIYANADGKAELANQLQQFLISYSNEMKPLGWHIYEWNEKNYLLFLSQDGMMLCGSAIRLENFMKEVLKSIEYPIAKIEMIEDADFTKSAGTLFLQGKAKDITLNIEVSKEAVLETVSFSQQLMWKVALIYLIVIPLLYIVLRQLLIHPLYKVNQAHRQVEQGNGEYRIDDKPLTAEYRELYNSFNRMADNLNRLKIESYEKELSRQRMELRNLQLQIRPHFLLNTFNIIFSLAQRKDHKMIQEMVIYLSDYFRYIFRSDKDLELFSKELNMIKGYVKTANIRYSGRVEAEYDMDPELDFIRMPPLLIHNFVENAVKYGIKKKEILHIGIEGKYEDGTVTFTIEDNGKGMIPEMLERNQKMFAGELKPKSATEHLGLYNSLKRLKYFYGDNASIEVRSRLGEGTCFIITFPYNVEVEYEPVDY